MVWGGISAYGKTKLIWFQSKERPKGVDYLNKVLKPMKKFIEQKQIFW